MADIAAFKTSVAAGDFAACESMLAATPLAQDPRALVEVSLFVDLRLMRLLLDAGADPDGASAGGLWPLHRAIEVEKTVRVRGDRSAAVEMLLDAGADPDAPGCWYAGRALETAARGGQDDLADILWRGGAGQGRLRGRALSRPGATERGAGGGQLARHRAQRQRRRRLAPALRQPIARGAGAADGRDAAAGRRGRPAPIRPTGSTRRCGMPTSAPRRPWSSWAPRPTAGRTSARPPAARDDPLGPDQRRVVAAEGGRRPQPARRGRPHRAPPRRRPRLEACLGRPAARRRRRSGRARRRRCALVGADAPVSARPGDLRVRGRRVSLAPRRPAWPTSASQPREPRRCPRSRP